MLSKLLVGLVYRGLFECNSGVHYFHSSRSVLLALAVMLSSFGTGVQAQTARSSYGQFEIPAQSRSGSSYQSGAKPANRNSVGYKSILGPQSMPSAMSSSHSSGKGYSIGHPTQRMNQKSMSRSSDRIGRGRVMSAAYQENIDTGEVAEPDTLPPSNPIPDVTGADEAMTGDLGQGQQGMVYGDPMMNVYEEGVYCDSCGDMGCGCGLRSHGSGMNECRLRLSVGALAFSNAMNFAGAGTNPWSGDGSGSFGFQESLQWSTPIPGLFYGEMGAQVGVRTVQANLEGAEFTADGRSQVYLTAGMFRRADYGLQGGLVVDYLAERWYLNTDLVQLRGELSYMFEPCHEFGFRFANGMQSSSSGGFILNDAGTLVSTSGTLTALNQYRLFTRHMLDQESATFFEISAGWTDKKHAVIGAMIETAICSQVNLQSSFNLGIPGDAVAVADHQQEQWQAGLMLVWTPSRSCFSGLQDYYRPLFEVADPGSFWVGHDN